MTDAGFDRPRIETLDRPPGGVHPRGAPPPKLNGKVAQRLSWALEVHRTASHVERFGPEAPLRIDRGVGTARRADHCGGYDAFMARIEMDLAPVPHASVDQLRGTRTKLLDLARRNGLSDVRLVANATPPTLVVHVDDEPTNKPVLRFVADATAVLGSEPHVITDDTLAAQTLPSARPL